jgi:hypothetical protein
MLLRSFVVTILGSVLALSSLSCSSSTTSGSNGSSGSSGGPVSTQPPVTTLFAPAVTSVTIEIDYAAGAEPYVGMVKDFGDPWDLFQANVLAIFDGKKTVSFPRTLAKMERLDDVPAKNFSNKDLLDVATAHRTEAQYSDAVAFYVVFVNGYWLDETGAERKDILGVSVPNSGVIGIFKPAISTPIASKIPPPQFVEQLTLIHQLSHAIGFVDNGIPVGDSNKAHVDTDNLHHCTNKQCALSFNNESATGANTYASTYIRSSGAVLIGQECLSDARLLENKLLAP